MKWITDRDLPHYDLYQTSSSSQVRHLILAYSGLVQYDPLDQDKIIPDLAERWDASSDGLTYTFHLRSGVRFHDGKPMTAEDARFSLERLMNPAQPDLSFYRSWFAMFKSIEAPDAQTVRISLKYPAAEFIRLLGLGIAAVLPKHVLQAKGDMRKDIVGTGPFKFKAQTTGTSLEFVRNDDYYLKDRPYLDGITFLVLKDQTTRDAALRTGQAHMTALGGAGPSPAEAKALQAQRADKINVWFTHDYGTEGVYMNTKRKPWEDVRVRKAVNLTLDRDAYGHLVFGDAFAPGAFIGFAPWALPQTEVLALPGYRSPKDSDRADAKRLLSDAGYPNGLSTSISVPSTADDRNKGEYVVDQLGRIGISVKINVLEVGAFQQKLIAYDYDMIIGGYTAMIPDPSPLLQGTAKTGGVRNYSQFATPEIDALIEQQAREADSAKRKAIVWDIQRKLFDALPLAPLGSEISRVAAWKTVRGWIPHDGRYTFVKHQDTWLSE